MLETTCEVVNVKGMHARAAAKIVSLVCQFESDVMLAHGEKKAPADSLIKLLTLNAPKGSTINIEVSGSDENKCLLALQELFERGFDE